MAVPFFLGMKLFEAFGLGVGIVFLIVGYRRLAQSGQSSGLSVLLCSRSAWYLGNWWLHDGLHAIAIGKLWATLGIEYGFQHHAVGPSLVTSTTNGANLTHQGHGSRLGEALR